MTEKKLHSQERPQKKKIPNGIEREEQFLRIRNFAKIFCMKISELKWFKK